MSIGTSGVLKELCTAPLDAVVKAEKNYRTIWINWIKQIKGMVDTLDETRQKNINWQTLFKTAPVVTLDQKIDLAITMRVASVKEVSANGELGLSLGPIHTSGSFGFMNRATTESTLQASTSVTISNAEHNLVDYLGKFNIEPASVGDLTNAVKLLEAQPSEVSTS
jgi:hypothetical protein